MRADQTMEVELSIAPSIPERENADRSRAKQYLATDMLERERECTQSGRFKGL